MLAPQRGQGNAEVPNFFGATGRRKVGRLVAGTLEVHSRRYGLSEERKKRGKQPISGNAKREYVVLMQTFCNLATPDGAASEFIEITALGHQYVPLAQGRTSCHRPRNGNLIDSVQVQTTSLHVGNAKVWPRHGGLIFCPSSIDCDTSLDGAQITEPRTRSVDEASNSSDSARRCRSSMAII